MKIKEMLKKLVYPHSYSSEAYIKYLRRGGVKIGSDCIFYEPTNTKVDKTSLMFIEIGNKVQITKGVIILGHDYSYSVCAEVLGKLPRKQKLTKIGNNVFIGMNSIILMGANIEDNVIIGAGSVVTGHCKTNSVYAGNPARQICSLEDYCARGEAQMVESARCWAKQFYERKGRLPEVSEMGFYTVLFVDKTDENMEKYFKNTENTGVIKAIKKMYNSVSEIMEETDNENSSNNAN